ncbi:MAG TPA: DUF6325 family protein [Solirubrobacteraceae bacterium]|nr:DUF6325 family protein [Solirubrobacteraceae bacterium]
MSPEDAQETRSVAEMGPIDYVVLEWPKLQPTGEVVPLIVDLVDRGVIRLLDVAFVAKDEDGSIVGFDIGGPESAAVGLDTFDGATSGLLDEEDLKQAADVIEPGAAAALLVWENTWAAPVATAMRRSGGQLVASGRIPIQAIVASLDAIEAGNSN